MPQQPPDIDPKARKGILFAVLSCCLPFVTILLMIEMAKPVLQESIKASESLAMPSPILTYSLWAALFLGIVCTVLSFMRKEKSRWPKYIGLLLNLIVVMLVLGPVIFAFLLDVMG